jgi:hypothetical protein
MDNIYTIFKPFLFLARFLGAFPMSFEGPASKGSLRFSKISAVFSLLSLTLLVLNIKSVFSYSEFDVQNSVVLPRAWKTLMRIQSVSFLINFGYQLKKMSRLVEFLEKLHEFDAKVSVVEAG